MYTPAFYSESFEDIDKNFITYDMFPSIVPYFESYNNDMFNKDLFSPPFLNNFEAADPSNYMLAFEKAMQTLPEELKQWFSVPFDTAASSLEETVTPLLAKHVKYYPQNKIGNLTVEERQAKVQKYLEKRKKRNFRKKISYICRKNVADKRIRVKGRFISKVEAEKIQCASENKNQSN